MSPSSRHLERRMPCPMHTKCLSTTPSRQKLPESLPTSSLHGPAYHHPFDRHGATPVMGPHGPAASQSADGLLADRRVGNEEADLPSQEVEVDLEESRSRGHAPRVRGDWPGPWRSVVLQRERGTVRGWSLSNPILIYRLFH